MPLSCWKLAILTRNREAASIYCKSLLVVYMLPSSIFFLVLNLALCLGCIPTYNSEEYNGGPFTTTAAAVTTGTSTGGTTVTGGSTTSVGTTSTGSTTTTSTSTTTTTTTPACLAGWVFFPMTMSCYLAVDVGGLTITQQDAETQCMTYAGGHLASIHSAQENSFILSLFSTNGNPIILGLYRTGPGPTDFAWYDGSLADYYNWAVHPPRVQPDNASGDQDCVAMFTESRYYGNGDLQGNSLEWNDNPCDYTQQYYVCQTPKL